MDIPHVYRGPYRSLTMILYSRLSSLRVRRSCSILIRIHDRRWPSSLSHTHTLNVTTLQSLFQSTARSNNTLALIFQKITFRHFFEACSFFSILSLISLPWRKDTNFNLSQSERKASCIILTLLITEVSQMSFIVAPLVKLSKRLPSFIIKFIVNISHPCSVSSSLISQMSNHA